MKEKVTGTGISEQLVKDNYDKLCFRLRRREKEIGVGSDNEEKYKFPFLCCFNKSCFFFLSTKFISFFLALESAKYFATAGGAIVRPVSAFGEGFLVGFSLT